MWWRARVALAYLALLGVVAWLTLALLLAARSLDETYQARRFVVPKPSCPLAVSRDQTVISPMCAPTRGW